MESAVGSHWSLARSRRHGRAHATDTHARTATPSASASTLRYAARWLRGSAGVVLALQTLLACSRAEPARLMLEAPGEVDVSVRRRTTPATWYLDVRRDGHEPIRIPSSGFLDTSAAYVLDARVRSEEEPAVVDIVPMRCADATDDSCEPAASRLSAGTSGWTLAASESEDDAPEIQLLLAPRGFKVSSPTRPLGRGSDTAGPAHNIANGQDTSKGKKLTSPLDVDSMLSRLVASWALGQGTPPVKDPGSGGPVVPPVQDSTGDAIRVVVTGADGSPFFTSLKDENRLRLRADAREPVAPDDVHWELVDNSTTQGWEVSPPPPGVESTLEILAPTPNRWAGVRHKGQVKEKALRLSIVAVVRHGGRTLRSPPITIEQDEISALRQEYVDLRLARGAPPRSAFVRMNNNGDYPYRVLRPGFKAKLDSLLALLPPAERAINSEYRNPVHNRFHVGAGSGTGPVSNSLHQYGCAADIQTFPRVRSSPEARAAAENFWEVLASEALDRGFQVEPRSGPVSSGVGHVHVQLRDCK